MLISHVIVRFRLRPINPILLNCLLQLLLTDRNCQTIYPLSVLFLVPEVDRLLHYFGNILFHCFVSSMPASLKSLSMPANDTGTLKIIFAPCQSTDLPETNDVPLRYTRLSLNSFISANRIVSTPCGNTELMYNIPMTKSIMCR
jgi:hypothetical protein